jgi:Icc-related predicted phosphoesterase
MILFGLSGHGDLTGGNNNVGCVELLNTVQKRVKPKYHVFGHIHEGKNSNPKTW